MNKLNLLKRIIKEEIGKLNENEEKRVEEIINNRLHRNAHVRASFATTKTGYQYEVNIDIVNSIDYKLFIKMLEDLKDEFNPRNIKITTSKDLIKLYIDLRN